jgi:hypothetical protein
LDPPRHRPRAEPPQAHIRSGAPHAPAVC